MRGASTAELGERIGCFRRVAADRVRVKAAEQISPAPAAPISAGAARLLLAGSLARASPAAPARYNVPATVKFPA